jgi:hypothetical protein
VLRLGQTVGPISFTLFAERIFETPLQGYRVLLVVCGVVVLVAGVSGYLRLRSR